MMRATRKFYRFVNRFGADAPPEAVERGRALYEAGGERAQRAFRLRVARHLTRRLAEDGPDPVARSAALLAAWFLAPPAA
jgi:hypothetical protein